MARAFIANLDEAGVGASTPIDSGRHVYTNWEPVLQKRGAHHPALNAFNLTEAPLDYTKDMCPHTLDVLARTVYLGTSPTRTPEERAALVEAVKGAARRL
jgi:hypothetical protein